MGVKRRFPRRASILAICAGFLTPVGALASPYLNGQVVGAPAVDGVELGGARERDATAAVTILARTWLDAPVSLVLDDVIVHRTRRELGARVDVPVTRREIFRRGRSGNLFADLAAHRVTRAELSLARRFDERAAAVALERLRRQVDVAPVAARIESTGRASPAASGRALSGLSASVALERGLLASASVIELPVQRLPAPATPSQPLGQALYTKVVTRFATRYATSDEQWGRVANIVAAATAIDGAILPAQQTLSFNELVGERTIARGFRPAEEINEGRVVLGIGGGICQVAATLHAAAFLGGLDIVEHHPHTGTSRYIEIGLDASVSWPDSDLKIHNPFAFPLRVRATAAGGELTIALLGAARGPNVQWSSEVESTLPRSREVELVSGRVPGGEEVVDEGADGLVLRRERIIHRSTGDTREVTHLSYPSMPRLVRVPQ